jgi:hypothetical protein
MLIIIIIIIGVPIRDLFGGGSDDDVAVHVGEQQHPFGVLTGHRRHWPIQQLPVRAGVQGI